MPNWCENQVDFTGPKEEIVKLHQAVGIANLNNYVSPIPIALTEVNDVSADNTSRPDLEKMIKFGHSDWYSWCVQNWGTKWEISDAQCHEDPYPIDTEDGPWTFVAYFTSAWSPPTGIYETLYERGIEVSATFFEPGCDFVGGFKGGKEETYVASEFRSGGVPENLISDWNLEEFFEKELDEVQEWYQDGVNDLKIGDAVDTN